MTALSPATTPAASVGVSSPGSCVGASSPYPVPFDLLAVGIAVALRWTSVMESSDTVAIQDTELGGAHYPAFAGFNVSELACLWCYRIRTG